MYTGEEHHNGGAFLTGLATGALIGAGLAFLFAPKAGSQLRGQLSESAERFRRQASDSYREASDRVGEMVEKGKDAYRRARHTAEEAATREGGTHESPDPGARGSDYTSVAPGKTTTGSTRMPS